MESKRGRGVGRGRALRQRVPHVGHLHVLAAVVVAAQLEHQRAHVRLQPLARHARHHLRHGQPQPLGALGLHHEERVQHAHALRQHRDLQLVLVLEVVEELLERDLALDLEPVPERPLLVVVGVRGRGDRLREAEEGQREVDKAVLEHVERVEALGELVELEADEAGDDGGGGRDGGDDLAGDELGAVAVGGRDLVVGRAEVRRGHDEVHVEVGVVVLLEVEGRYLEALQLRGRRQVGQHALRAVAVQLVVMLLQLSVCDRDLDAGLGTEFWYLQKILFVKRTRANSELFYGLTP